MKKNIMNKLTAGLFALLFITGLSSCIKDNFDVPPSGGKDPNIVVNCTIDMLKQLYTGSSYYINQDLVISAIVTADDKSGNFYKQIIIQDSTGGIALKLEGSSIFNDYPIGRRIFVKLKGLYLVQYKGVYQIAGNIAPDGSFDGIPTALYDKFVLKGTYFHTVLPKVKTIAQLTADDQSTLIELDHVEFQTADAGQPFADGFNKQSVGRMVKGCSGGSVEMYNSGYALFANHLTPTGNGKLLAIYSLYNTTGQLLLRDESDLHLDSVRCGGNPVGGTNGIMGIRNLWSGSDLTIPSGKTVTGIVISDGVNLNTDPKNMVIQDSTGGMVIRFSGTHSFLLGDKVTVDLSGQTLTVYNGLYEATFVPTANATLVGTGTITPRVATCADINANSLAWQSTLITVQSANVTGSTTTYSGDHTLTDVTGTLKLHTRTQALFASSALPSGTKSFTGVLGEYSGAELDIRSLADVQ